MPVCVACGHETAEAFKFCPECGAPPATDPSREQRKTVTVLFCDVTGSTSLGESTDPEALRVVLARYFERMKAVVESHGGTVEKFIGDAVMAVFGVPQVHEDDALRACRAAVEMRDALPDLGVEARIGVNTGEVVTGTEERLATGDAVNVAARLEQAAPAGEILIGADTFAIVQNAVEAEPVDPLELKGKSEAVRAHRLLRVTGDLVRAHSMLMVGRETELGRLRGAYDEAVRESSCRLFTVVGEAGVGKSRLVREAVARLDALVVAGRCLPYGEGITYLPVVEVLRQLEARPPDTSAAAAIESLLRGEVVSADGIAWALRKTLEAAGRERPLVCVFDDIQWGESTFLDLVEQLALLSTQAPILLVCMARPELLERRPSWPVELRLDPLEPDDVHRLLPDEIEAEVRNRISEAAGGNPLFVAQMVAATRESGGAVAVPPTLKALLAARLDQLEPDERRLLECAAVEGEVFHARALHELADGGEVTPLLVSLVRRQLVEPAEARLRGEDGFAFHHLLIRDAAYESMTKRRRADLHERLARWLDQSGPELVELDELVGYHLEQACLYRAELGDDAGTLVGEASERLAAAGYRAFRRQDYAAGVGLLQRASVVLPADRFDLVLEAELRDGLYQLGRNEEAEARGETLAARGAGAGDEVATLAGKICVEVIRTIVEPTDARARLLTAVESALPVFEAAQDDAALYLAYDALGWLPGATWTETLDVTETAVRHARRLGHEPTTYIALASAARFLGSTPAADVLAWLDEQGPAAASDHFVLAYRAGALAMLGRFDEARAILSASRAQLAEQGPSVLLANITGFESVWVELWAGRAAAAVEFAAQAFEVEAQLGEYTFAAIAAGTRARALYAAESFEEAEAWADRAAELAGRGEELGPAALWRHVKAKLLARRGESAEAERLALEACDLLGPTDYLNNQGDALLDFAEVLKVAGRAPEAARRAKEAFEAYEQKGNVAAREQAHAFLADLGVPV